MTASLSMTGGLSMIGGLRPVQLGEVFDGGVDSGLHTSGGHCAGLDTAAARGGGLNGDSDNRSAGAG